MAAQRSAAASATEASAIQSDTTASGGGGGSSDCASPRWSRQAGMSVDGGGTAPSGALGRAGYRDAGSPGGRRWSPLLEEEVVVKQTSRSLELPPRLDPDLDLDLDVPAGDRYPKAIAAPAAEHPELDLDLDLNRPQPHGTDFVESVSLPRFLLQTR